LIPALSFGRLWLGLAVLLPVLGALATPMSTVDLAYHIRVGETILATGAIPRADYLTFTALGRPWVDQQWLAQVVFAATFGLGGWELLAVLRAALVGLIFGLVAASALAHGIAPRRAAWLSIAAFVVGVVTLSLRPQLLAMALFAAGLLVVSVRRREPRALWLLPVIGLLWANVHGSFVLAPILAGFAWLEDLFDPDASSARTLRIAAATFLATLLNPFGWGAWVYAFNLAANPLVTTRISEWQPTSFRTFAGLVFFASALLLVAYLARRSARTSWLTLAWLAFLFVVGAFAERGVAWWPLGAAVAVAGLLAADVRAGVLVSREPRPSMVNGAIAIVLGVAVLVLLPWWRPTEAMTARRGLLDEAPAGLVKAVADSTDVGARLFVPQRWGSWFEFALPDRPVFVDSRVEVFPAAVWADEAAISGGHDGWQATLDRWAVDAIVVDAASGEEVAQRLSIEPGWVEAAADADGWLFVRR
jgi:hypothetical protein